MRERHLRDIKQASMGRDSLVSIGVYDGVHIGHQTLIKGLVESATATGRAAVVITFFPHPDTILHDVSGPYYLTTPDKRAELLLALGVDLVITQAFDDELRHLPAEGFVELLVEHLNIKELWVGADFALGFKREGDIAFLRAQGKKRGFTVTAVDLITTRISDKLVRSSKIREYVRLGKMTDVKSMLGRSYTLEGRVGKGDQRGRTIGVPTANLQVWSEQIVPANGVYATWAKLGDETFMAATNIGLRPTFDGQALSIEAHLLGFDRDIYGAQLELRFEKRLRAERKFDNLEELVAQIKADIAAARSYLERDLVG